MHAFKSGISVGLFKHMNFRLMAFTNRAPITETSFCEKDILQFLQFDFGSLSPIVNDSYLS